MLKSSTLMKRGEGITSTESLLMLSPRHVFTRGDIDTDDDSDCVSSLFSGVSKVTTDDPVSLGDSDSDWVSISFSGVCNTDPVSRLGRTEVSRGWPGPGHCQLS